MELPFLVRAAGVRQGLLRHQIAWTTHPPFEPSLGQAQISANLVGVRREYSRDCAPARDEGRARFEP